MNIEFDREEALKQLRLMTFEKRAVATMTASGGGGGANQGETSKFTPLVGGMAPGGSNSAVYQQAKQNTDLARQAANNAISKPRPQRIAMKTPSKLSASKMGMGVSNSSGGQLSVGKVRSPSTKAPKAPGMTTLASVGMSKAAHIVALQKEARVGFIAKGIDKGFGLLGRGIQSAKSSFMKGYTQPAASKAVPDAAPKAADGVDKAFDFAKRIFSSESPKAALKNEAVQAAKGFGGKALRGTARFAWNRGKSATKFGVGAGGAAMTYSALKNPGLTLKEHAARAAPYAAGGVAFGAGGPLLLGAPAAAMVKPSVQRYLQGMKDKSGNPIFKNMPGFNIGSDFGKATGLLESDAARRRRSMKGLASMTAKDIRNLKV